MMHPARLAFELLCATTKLENRIMNGGGTGRILAARPAVPRLRLTPANPRFPSSSSPAASIAWRGEFDERIAFLSAGAPL
jgi:hypothetical protein